MVTLIWIHPDLLKNLETVDDHILYEFLLSFFFLWFFGTKALF